MLIHSSCLIPFDAAYQHTMQAGRVCTESESDPTKMAPDRRIPTRPETC
jgi:hypothetical protein